MAGWTVIVPLKALPAAKSRLTELPPAQRAELALAFARDVVAAAGSCPAVTEVVVLTADETARGMFAGAGLRVLPDSGTGLNAELGNAATALVAGEVALAVLPADLPALTPAALHAALRAVPAGGSGFVPDSTGDGTTLLAVRGVPLVPRYGPGSAVAHAATGAVALAAPAALRQDVDTSADLDAVTRLGVGGYTATALGASRVQGTVAEVAADGSGIVLVRQKGLAFPAAAVHPAIRLLRTGQRVELLTRGGVVDHLRVPGWEQQ